MKTTACSTVAAKNTTNRGNGCATMNCVPTMPARNPTIVFASPPMPMTAARQRVLHQAGRPCPPAGPSPVRTSARRTRRRPAPDRRPRCRGRRTGRAWSAGRRDATIARITPAAFTRRSPRPAACAGVSTTSTSSSARKSTAGLTTIRLYAGAVLLDRLHLADDESLRDRSPSMPDVIDRVADHDVRHFRHVLHAQPLVAAADDHALRPRSLDHRAGRRVAIDQQLHFRGAPARHRPPGRRRRRARSPPCRRARRRPCPCRSSRSGNPASPRRR